MTYPEAAEAYRIPLFALNELKKRNVLWSDDVLSDEELSMIKGIALIWGDAHFLRKQMTRYSKKQREAIISNPALTKPERFMFNRIMKIKMADHTTEVHIHQLASEVIYFFKMRNDEKTFAKMLCTAKKMRRKANYERQKVKNNRK